MRQKELLPGQKRALNNLMILKEWAIQEELNEMKKAGANIIEIEKRKKSLNDIFYEGLKNSGNQLNSE